MHYLRMRPRVTVVFRSGWDWVAVEGDADLAGPDDHLEGLETSDVPRVLREVYAAAVGGTQEQWVELDAALYHVAEVPFAGVDAYTRFDLGLSW